MLDVHALSQNLGMSSLLAALRNDSARTAAPPYELVDHWAQGEFHHDVVLRVGADILVVATNCNGGIKEIVAFQEVPDRYSLWHWRCPDNAEFAARATRPLPRVRAVARTTHHFDPCELLAVDARSELKPSCRRRAVGGGWQKED